MPNPKVDKLVVTNVAALKAKYGAKGVTAINAAMRRLISADKKRGLRTVRLALDSVAAMKRVRGVAVTDKSAPRAYKEAIDAAFEHHTPDYLVLLGATDVIPHQDLTNPLFSPGQDDDADAASDLPYACAASYSRRIGDFRAPSRVVGRLPDLTGGRDPGYLVSLLDVAARYQRSPRDAYARCFAITAQVWKASTVLSVSNVFGRSNEVQVVPPRTHEWPADQVAARMHFINCHGAPADSHFYGQRGEAYPVAHDAAYLPKRVTAGTVVAAECCYGAELYAPELAMDQPGICSTYLSQGAYGFFGSSTIAYGPSSGNGFADVICQVFLQRVLQGASLGRAALEARQHFVQSAGVLDPTELKTLAQFNLLGDPAVVPVLSAKPALTQTKGYAAAFAGPAQQVGYSRRLRRQQLARMGTALLHCIGTAERSASVRPSAKVRATLERSAREAGVHGATITSFGVHDPGKSSLRTLRTAKLARSSSPKSSFLVLIGSAEPPPKPRTPAPKTFAPRHIVVITATVADGKVVRLRRAHSR
jgi:hypothetical protein